MALEKNHISFSDTHYFSKIALDYVQQNEKLKPFIQQFPSNETLAQQIELKSKADINRKVLQQVFIQQYAAIPLHDAVRNNIELLTNQNTFTICTAHQPCIFTGPLYFIYKISHAIQLAQYCKTTFPAYDFVPVFYIGSEDNDLEEIGTFFLENQKHQWDTKQTGACGRMQTKDLEAICREVLALLNEQIAEEAWLIKIIKEAYQSNKTLSEATRIFVNGLFEKYGLLVLDADDKKLKQLFAPIIQDELWNQNSQKRVLQTTTLLEKEYNIQAAGRNINLFYLKDNIRERIEKVEDRWVVLHTDISFSEEELLLEVKNHPEHFSPNVILRPLYQETILPNIAFVGGGGELAYWLELKKVFDYYEIVYPILFLRNSFLIVDHNSRKNIEKLGLHMQDLFLPTEILHKKLLAETDVLQKLQQNFNAMETLLLQAEGYGASLSVNLHTSVKAHHAKANRILKRIEQKFMAQLKRNESDKIHGIDNIKHILFPSNSLQERHDNFIPYFKKFGKNLIDIIIDSQEGLESKFIILTETTEPDTI